MDLSGRMLHLVPRESRAMTESISAAAAVGVSLLWSAQDPVNPHPRQSFGGD